MTDRPSKEERERASEKPGIRARSPGSHPDSETTVLDLQGLAGNRAVADLLGDHEVPLPAESHGMRVRDLLRSGRRPTQPTVQAQGILDAESGKESWGEKGGGSTEKAWGEEKGGGSTEKAWGEEKGGGSTEKAWGEEKGGGSTEKAWGEEKGGGQGAASPMLAAGSSGPAVVRLQQLLASAGFAVAADGVFGPGTRAAVIAFQVSQGLAADGIVGPGTRSALEGSTPISAGAESGGLAATGEMELAEPEWAMEKAGSGGGGTGEATLPQPDGWTKQGGEPDAKLPEAEPWATKEST